MRCSRCGKAEARPGQRWCHDCHAEWMRENRPRHQDLTPEQRKRANARAYANVYLRRGKIQRQGCEVCSGPAEMHHDDYDRPLDVRWLCRDHHLAHHEAVAGHVERWTARPAPATMRL